MALTGVDVARLNDDVFAANKNLIINGAMQVSQRTTSEAGITATKYSACDRFRFSGTNLGTWTVSQEADGPSGFSNSYKQLCTTADASPAAADILFLAYRLEGYDVQSLAYGTSGAKTTTLSFWVKSNKTGQASLEITNGNGTSRKYLSSYTINVADTWEYKTVVIPGDTDVSGVIQADNAVRLNIYWWFNSGSDYTGGSLPPSTWDIPSNDQRNYYNLGLGGAINDYIQITGVQLEVGDTATPFEHRNYGQELALCQRYYQIIGPLSGVFAGRSTSTTTILYQIPLAVPLRASPTLNIPATAWYTGSGSNAILDNVGTNTAYGYVENSTMFSAIRGGYSGLTDDRSYTVYISSNPLTLSSEL